MAGTLVHQREFQVGDFPTDGSAFKFAMGTAPGSEVHEATIWFTDRAIGGFNPATKPSVFNWQIAVATTGAGQPFVVLSGGRETITYNRTIFLKGAAATVGYHQPVYLLLSLGSGADPVTGIGEVVVTMVFKDQEKRDAGSRP